MAGRHALDSQIGAHRINIMAPGNGGTAAVGDGVVNDTAAFQNAQALANTGTIKDIYLPGGRTFLVDEAAFYISTSHLRYFSDLNNRATVRFRAGGPTVNAMLQATTYVEGITIEDIIWDGNGVAVVGLSFNAFRGPIRVRRNRFINTNAATLSCNSVEDVVIEDNEFDDMGRPRMTAIGVQAGARNVTIRRNRFMWVKEGIIGAASVHGDLIDNLRVHDNYFDQGWWLLCHKTANSGSAVTYTSSTLTDSSAAFTSLDLAANDTVRVMPVKRTGTVADFQLGVRFSDSTADFVTAGVRRGDILRSGSKIAAVAAVESATVLEVDAWWDDTTRAVVAPPAPADSYTVYGVVLGRITDAAAHVLTIQYFHDFDGIPLTPAAGTRYEVMHRKGNYGGVHCEYGVRNSIFRDNVFRRGWSDQLSIFGSHNVVEGNQIEDGQDAGITVQEGSHNVVVGNHVRHQGALGIFAGCFHSTVVGNVVTDTGWQNWFDPGACDLVVGGAGCVVVGNRARKETAAMIRPRGMTVDGTGQLIVGNELDGYTDAIYLLASSSGCKVLGNIASVNNLAGTANQVQTGDYVTEANGHALVRAATNNGSLALEIQNGTGSQVAHVNDDGAMAVGNLRHGGTSLVLFGGPAATQAADIPTTSGATLAQLEAEANKIKAALRRYSLIASPVPFDPTTISNLQAWFKAGRLPLADGDSVASWTDLGSFGRHAVQATAGARPLFRASVLNGQPVVRFDGVDDKLVAGWSQAYPITVFVVGKFTTHSGFPSVVAGPNGNPQIITSDGFNFKMYSGSFLTGPTIDTNWHIFVAQFAGAGTSRFIVDGSAVSGAAGNFPGNGVTIGDGVSFNGDVAEVIVYSGLTGDADLNTLGASMVSQYNATGTPVSWTPL